MIQFIDLPFKASELQPVMSAETIEFHHGKHHKGYVDTLNSLIAGTEMDNWTLEKIVTDGTPATANPAGQTLNHNIFFSSLRAPQANNAPSGALADAINRDFSSFEAFKEQFSKAAVSLFGSGWAWLSADANGKLHISQESNAGNPLRAARKPLFTFDVWEHAYYIDYRNRRKDFIDALWSIINWDVVAARL